ncbi:MAG: hypothetical protein JWR51_3906 [Devosia sp.]|uniref:hypothetical protein n=1 Tax=Devosia sp. TaxID=1871048 RepID=UPI00261D31B8|nr:hypothetical protein [Devosia sp.]MDB5530803.1 hypothetical protein [Devosia sp.]
MTDPAPRPVRQRRFPWRVYLVLLALILLLTIFPFFMMVSDPNLGVLLVITAPLGMGAVMVWGITLVIHRLAWGRHNRPVP